MKNQPAITAAESELKAAYTEQLAIREQGIFGKPRIANCRRVINAIEALVAAKRASR